MESYQYETDSIGLGVSNSKILNDGEPIIVGNESIHIVKGENSIPMEKEFPVHKSTNENTIAQSLDYTLKNQDINKNELIDSDERLSYTNDTDRIDAIKENKYKQEELGLIGNNNLNEKINGGVEIDFQETINDNTEDAEIKVENSDNQSPSSNLDNEVNRTQIELELPTPHLSNIENDYSSINKDTVELREVNHKDESNASEVNHAQDIMGANEIKEVEDIPIPMVSESPSISHAEFDKLENENYAIQETVDGDNFVDILGNGLLTKRVIKHGLGRETRPTHGDSVTIEYKGWNSTGDSIASGEVSFVLGDGDMIQAFDLGICLAERQEEFELKTDARFAYGSYGWEPHVQPNESLTYWIKLLRVDDAPDYTVLSHDDRMAAADFKRERGNYLYRREEYSLAVNSYSRAIKIIETDPDYKRASTKADMYDLFVKVTNNLAAAQLKLESYDNVIETCNTILNYDASNVKALFRKGKSLTMKGNYDEAIPILKRALELENSKLIASEIQRCYQLKRAEDEQRARVCRKMFGTGAKETPDKGQAPEKPSWKKIVYKYSPYIGAVLFLIGAYILTKPSHN